MAACDVIANKPVRLLSTYEAMPIVLAEDSESADVTEDVVDVGEGTNEADYAGKNVKGKIVLVGAQPGVVQDLAVGKFGAAGIVSYVRRIRRRRGGARTENLIRWGHLETFSANKTFAFMVSLKTATAMKEWLAQGKSPRDTAACDGEGGAACEQLRGGDGHHSWRGCKIKGRRDCV